MKKDPQLYGMLQEMFHQDTATPAATVIRAPSEIRSGMPCLHAVQRKQYKLLLRC